MEDHPRPHQLVPPQNAYTGCMLKMLLSASLLVFAAALFGAASVYEFTLNSIDGAPAPLAPLQRKSPAARECGEQVRFHAAVQGSRSGLREVQGPGIGSRGFPGQQFRRAGTWHE